MYACIPHVNSSAANSKCTVCFSKQGAAQRSVADGISEHMNKNWPLSCFSAVTDKAPELRNAPNEINGDISFEEVRWADYQEPNKQTCADRFGAACQAKLAQFQVVMHMQMCRNNCHDIE